MEDRKDVHLIIIDKLDKLMDEMTSIKIAHAEIKTHQVNDQKMIEALKQEIERVSAKVNYAAGAAAAVVSAFGVIWGIVSKKIGLA